MRRWYKYIFSNKIKENINDRFVFTNYTLIYDNDNFEDNFNFEKFKKNKVFYKQYKFLNKSLDSDKETLFIGSSWGGSEFFLKDKFKLKASDVDDKYINYHKKNTDLNFINLDILNLDNCNHKYEQIVVNNIEYLFDDNEMKKCIENTYKLSAPNAKIFVIFRSRDGFLIKLIDQYLLFIETYFVFLVKRLKNKIYFVRGHHGFRRNLGEFKKMWSEHNFEFQHIYEDLYESDIDRLRIVKKLKISSFLSKISFKSSPYLNILVFKRKPSKLINNG